MGSGLMLFTRRSTKLADLADIIRADYMHLIIDTFIATVANAASALKDRMSQEAEGTESKNVSGAINAAGEQTRAHHNCQRALGQTIRGRRDVREV